MKELTKEEKIKKENDRHKEAIMFINWEDKHDTSKWQDKVAMCLGKTGEKLIVGKAQRARVWDRAKTELRWEIARAWLTKAMVIRANVTEGSYLSMASFKMSRTYYSIGVWLWKGASISIKKDLTFNPTDEQVIAFVKSTSAFQNKNVEVTRNQSNFH